MNQVYPISYSIPKRDSGIIAHGFLPRLKNAKIINFKAREAISTYSVDSICPLLLTKIPLAKNAPIKDLVNLDLTSVERSTGITYYILNVDQNTVLQFQVHQVKPVSKIWLTLSGDSLKSEVNDSIIKYSCLCSNFSMRYGEKEPIDIYMAGSDDPIQESNKFPLNLLFLKRASAIYLFLMVSGNTQNKNLPADVIDNVFD